MTTTLTPRQVDILACIQKGMTSKEIARELDLSFHTVRDHTRHIYSRLGVKTRLQAALRACELQKDAA
jgi:DNA-binding NarL/FixJ family response regulator